MKTLRTRRRTRRGAAMIYISVVIVLMLLFCSLAVDVARVQLAKTELQRAADSAARAAASQMGSSTKVRDTAALYAGYNKCDGTSVIIDKSIDVQIGSWDAKTKTFTASSGTNSDVDSVQVTCARRNSRGNAIPLYFAFGTSGKCDVAAVAVAYVQSIGYGMVGLDYVKLSGNATASYSSATGSKVSGGGNIASNGNITSTGSSKVDGNVYVQSGATVSGVTGKVKTLSSLLTYPNGSSAPYTTTFNDNGKLSSGYNASTGDLTVTTPVSIPGGNYVINNFSATASVTFTGPTTIYFYGNVNLAGNTTTSSNVPGNLSFVGIPKLNGLPPGSVTLAGTSALYASFYAPQSNITVTGNGDLYGSLLGKSISITGNGDVFYDVILGGTGAIRLVK